ncbi:MAG: hypothetical protein N2045_03375 [Fimbriimonadales bacterium]|jgi:hypothetical protein|nr:hypothetical protein [Fimbriimonadales bacterium]CUU02443.1 hypothetical protein GBSOP10_101816 [Armatimonadetes bacterium GBS]CUU36967.1 hypothetical protein GXSOP10_12978 [Armatimonadetes bacterium GXS]
MRVLFATIIGLVWVLTGRAQSVNLQTVPELGKPITVRSARLTLADLVRRVAQETDVRLGVAKEIEQEKLTLFVSEKPAWQILHLAARVLELEWHREPEKGGYYLIRPTTTSPNARRNRELQESRKRMEQALREWQQQASTDFVALRTQLDKIEAQRAQIEGSRPPGWQDALTALAQQRANLVPCAESLPAYLVGWLTARFGREQWNRFWQGLPLLATYPQRGSALELPQQVLTWFAAQQSPKIQEVPIQSVGFLFYLKQGTLYAFLIARTPQEHFVHPAQFQLDTPQAPTTSGKVVGEIPNLPIARKPNDTPPPCPYYGGVCTLAESLEWLTGHCEIPVIAESFRLPMRQPPIVAANSLAEWAQHLVQTEPVEVRYEEGFLCVRYLDAWRWRLSEIPERLLEPFEQRALQQGGLSLDDYAELANQLTPSQQARIEQGGLIALRFDPTPLQQGIPVLRFWANLMPSQKQAARERQPLAYEQLTATQQRLFWDALEWGLTKPQMMTPGLLDELDALYTPEATTELAFFLDDWKQNTYRVSNGEITIVFEDEQSYRESLSELPSGARPYSVSQEVRHEYMFHFGFDSQRALICPLVITQASQAKSEK